MTTRTMLTALLVLSGLSANLADEPAKPPVEPANSRVEKSHAKAIVRVQADPKLGLTNRVIVEAMMTQDLMDETLESIARQLKAKGVGTGKLASDAARVVTSDPANLAIGDEPPGICTFIVDAVSFDESFDAASFLKEWVNLLGGELNSLYNIERDGQQSASHGLQLERQVLMARLKKAQRDLNNLAKIHSCEVNPDLQTARTARVHEELENAKVQLIGLEAREGVIQKQLAETLAAAAEAKDDDAVLRRLVEIVKINREALDRLRTMAVTMPPELANAEEKLARAEAELAQYKREVQASRRASELRVRLETTLEERAELEARAKALAHLDVGMVPQVELKRLLLDAMKQRFSKLSDEIAAQRKVDDLRAPDAKIKILSRTGK